MADAVKADPATVEKVLTLINDARQGLRPLKPSTRLCQAAQEHAEDMARKNYFNYTPPDGGEGVEARIRRLNYNGRTGYNLGRNRQSPEEAVQSWLEDDTTRAGVMDPDHRQLGVGNKDGYWTLLLGTPDEIISDALRTEMLGLLNDLRGRYHIPPVELQRQLNYIAQMHCLDFSKRRFFDHVNPDDKDVGQRAKDVDYHSRVYELIGEGETPAEVFEKWAENGAFRSQLTNDNNKLLGVGMFEAKWVMVLGLPVAEKSSGPPPKAPAELKADLSKQIAEQRTLAKLPPFREHPLLQAIVEGHAADMVAKNFLAYEHPGVPGIPGRVKESGYKGRIFPAITKGQGSAEAVMKLFLGSDGHKKNLLDPEFRDIGLAVRDEYWVLLVGAPQAESGSDLRGEVMRLLNAQRATVSAPALAQSSLLNAIAQDYAQDMARRDFFGFTNPEGKGPHDLAKSDGFLGQVLPSLLRGASTPDGAVSAWLKSPQSRASLLDPQYTLFGIGLADARWILLLGTAGPGTASA